MLKVKIFLVLMLSLMANASSLYDEMSAYSIKTLDDNYIDDEVSGSILDNEAKAVIAEGSEVKISQSKELKAYRKLFINDLEIMLSDENGDEEVDLGVIKAKYRDDLQFECEMPRKLYRGTYDWSINGYYLGINESIYNIVLDKRAQTNNTFLNVSCYFQLLDDRIFTTLEFPPINLGFF